jgi:hypothetical protein
MRAHGEPGFPDPTDRPPSAPPSGGTAVVVLRDMVFTLGPGVGPRSPAFRQASAACGLRPPTGVKVPSP